MQQRNPNEIDAETGKPIVHYTSDTEFHFALGPEYLWEYARVWAIDHPILGEADIHTSRVIRKFEGGFETMNTIYKWMDDSGWGG